MKTIDETQWFLDPDSSPDDDIPLNIWQLSEE